MTHLLPSPSLWTNRALLTIPKGAPMVAIWASEHVGESREMKTGTEEKRREEGARGQSDPAVD